MYMRLGVVLLQQNGTAVKENGRPRAYSEVSELSETRSQRQLIDTPAPTPPPIHVAYSMRANHEPSLSLGDLQPTTDSTDF